MNIKQYWENRVTLPERDANSKKRTTAVVEFSDEYENVCNIRYIDSNNRERFWEDAPVYVTSEDDQWFPSVGEVVDIVLVGGKYPVIMSKHVDDYIQDVRYLRWDENDLLAEDPFGPGGCINV